MARSPARLALAAVTGILILVVLPVAIHGYTFRQAGVSSNILVLDKKVHFIQGDGTITVLDLETGSVLKRRTGGRFYGLLIPRDGGILVGSSWSGKLLDAETLEVIRAFDGDDMEPIVKAFRKGHPSSRLVHGQRHDWGPGRGCVVHYPERGMGSVLHLQWDSVSWYGYFEYVGRWRGIVQVAVAEGRLLVGTALGHLECIDIATGRSLWLYRFPTLHIARSWTFPHGAPPRYVRAAAIFREDNELAAKARGMVRLPKSCTPGDPELPGLLEKAEKPTPRIITDPKPCDPFADLNLVVTVAWLRALILLGVLLASEAVKRWRKIGDAAGAAPALSVLVATYLISGWYGWVAKLPEIALMMVSLAALGIVLYRSARLIWAKRKIGFIFAAVAILFGILRLMMFSLLLR